MNGTHLRTNHCQIQYLDKMRDVYKRQPLFRLNKKQDREKEYAWLSELGIAGIKVDFFSGDSVSTMNYLSLIHIEMCIRDSICNADKKRCNILLKQINTKCIPL